MIRRLIVSCITVLILVSWLTGCGGGGGGSIPVTPSQPDPTSPSAISSFSVTRYTPGAGFVVSITAIPTSAALSYAVEDAVPAGWTVSQINNGGSWDAQNGKVKLGLFTDNTPRTLSYTVTPPSGTTGVATFTGVASVDGASFDITGARTIDVNLPTMPSATSSFSAPRYVPGTGFLVSITVAPTSAALSYAVEDAVPAGWTVSQINNSGNWDAQHRKVKWGLFTDNTPRTFSYTVTPPSGTEGVATFAGIVSVDGASFDITGTRTIALN